MILWGIGSWGLLPSEAAGLGDGHRSTLLEVDAARPRVKSRGMDYLGNCGDVERLGYDAIAARRW